MKKLIASLAALALLCSCSGPVQKTAHGFKTSTDAYDYEIVCYTPSIVRVFKAAPGSGLCPDAPISLVAKPERVKYSVETAGDTIVMKTSKIVVTIANDEVYFSDVNGRELLQEKYLKKDDAYQAFVLEDGECVYGLGQHQTGDFNLRGKSVTLKNWNTEVGIPVLHSSKGYAIWWNNYSESWYEDNAEQMSFRSSLGSVKDYFFIYGGSADGVVAGIRQLSGDAPLSPLWVYGFHQSRERYVSQEQIVGVVKQFRDAGVPLDGIVQDWQYWGTDHKGWNAVQFLNPEFPDPKAMMDDIHGLNAHCSISIWPSFGPETDIYKELEAIDALLPFETFPPNFGVKVYDPFNPAARDIYWSYVEKLYDLGLDGWWLDATEPEIQGPVDDDTMTSAGLFKSMHNAFAIASISGVYDHQIEKPGCKRPFILTRSASLGTQRYGAHVWSGDIVSSWEHLAQQVPEALSFTLTGLPYWNSDIGGFFTANYFPGGNQNPEYQRLYLRWMEYACFTGMMRSHGTHTFREIFNFGERGDYMFDAQEKYIRLRYRLLPYIYSIADDITSNRGSLMRPLVMDWPEDEVAIEIKDEFMFGKSILVAPVTSDSQSRQVYLPAGTWYDFWTGERIEGGVTFECEADYDVIPLFVKAGTILPVGPDVQYSSEKPWDSLQLRVYPGADGKSTIYEDAFDGLDYKKGQCSRIQFSWNDAENTLNASTRTGTYKGMLSSRTFNVVVVGPGKAVGLDHESCDSTFEYLGSKTAIVL